MADSADSALLRVWETARLQSLPRRASAMLQLTRPECPPETSNALALGEATRRLLQWRSVHFGPRLDCVAECGACGCPIEFEFDGRALAAELAAADTTPIAPLSGEGWQVSLRPPTLADCVAAADAGDAAQALRLLLERCVVAHGADGTPLDAHALPESALAACDARLETANAAAECVFCLSCPACAQEMRTTLDIVAFCWAEIEARAPQLLAEVHLLASHYGWREDDILSMSRLRRDHYLGLVLS
jgi:hypothetical protein